MNKALVFVCGVLLGALIGLHPLLRYRVVDFRGMPVRFDRLFGNLEQFPAFTFNTLPPH